MPAQYNWYLDSILENYLLQTVQNGAEIPPYPEAGTIQLGPLL